MTDTVLPIKCLGGVIIGATYLHYKGHKYKVLGFAQDSEDLDRMLVLYTSDDHDKDGLIWARPLSMWFDKISEGVTRFSLINKPEE